MAGFSISHDELPFRKHFSHADDGQTTRPATSSGIIAKAIMFDPKDIPIVDFFPIAGKVVDVPNEVRKGLSTEQGYLLKGYLTVQVGHDSSCHFKF